MTDEPTTMVCESCRQLIGGESYIDAVELHHADTFGGPTEPIEGLGVKFHKRCWSTTTSST